MSITRAALRRKIALRAGEPFFRKFGIGQQTASANGTTTTLVDTTLLLEEDNFWRGYSLYLPSSDETRELSAFTNTSSTATWLAPIASSTSTSDPYELWSQFTALEVNEAINYALTSAWPYFFLATNDQTQCVKDASGLVYTLPTTNTIKRLCQVYLLIYNSNASKLTSVGADATQINDTSATFTASDVGKKVAIYKNDSNNIGEVRTVTAFVSSSELTTAAFSAAPASGASYRLIDTTDVFPAQYLMQNWVVDKYDIPTQVWFGDHPSGFEGHIIKYIYEYEHPSVSAEATSITCPEEFVIAAALAYLYMLKMASAPAVEIPTWQAMHKAMSGAAQLYAQGKGQQHMPATIVKHDTVAGFPADYPFRG